MSRIFRKKSIIGYCSIFLFLLALPISKSITYIQNDEYTHYRLIWQFLEGNFTLDPYIGATFYAQGISAMLYSKIFGWETLPVLTLIVSILSFYTLAKILNNFFNQSQITSILLSLIMFLNPIFLYSSFGFMTENYFLLFMLGSVYFIFSFTNAKTPRDKILKITLANIFIVLAYFVRQFSFITSISFTLYLFLKKNFKFASIQLILFVALLFFHYKLFPITPQMYDSNLNILQLLDFKNTVNIVFATLVYVALFLAPLVLLLSITTFKHFNIFKKLLFIVFATTLAFYLKSNFKPYEITFTNRLRTGEIYVNYANTNFPYFDNVFERKGFLTNDIRGTKYHYRGFFDLFIIFENLGILLAILLISTALFNVKKIFEFQSVYIFGFLALLILAPRIFDRYLIPLLPMFILFFASLNQKFSTKYKKFLIVITLLFWTFLNYIYLADYIKINNYVWQKSESIAIKEDINRKYINPTHAWRQLYSVTKKETIYLFSYDSPENEPNLKGNFELIDTFDVKFFGSIYIEPKIFLYKRINNSN